MSQPWVSFPFLTYFSNFFSFFRPEGKVAKRKEGKEGKEVRKGKKKKGTKLKTKPWPPGRGPRAFCFYYLFCSFLSYSFPDPPLKINKLILIYILIFNGRERKRKQDRNTPKEETKGKINYLFSFPSFGRRVSVCFSLTFSDSFPSFYFSFLEK